MHHNSLSPQAAIDHVVKMIHQSYRRFEYAEHRLYEEAVCSVYSEELRSLKVHVETCKHMVVGHLEWTYAVSRYKVGVTMQEDGTRTFQVCVPAKLKDAGR